LSLALSLEAHFRCPEQALVARKLSGPGVGGDRE